MESNNIPASSASGADMNVEKVTITADSAIEPAAPPTPKELLQKLKDDRKFQSGLTVSQQLEMRRLSKKLNGQSRQGAQFRAMFEQYNKRQTDHARRMMTRVRVLADTIGRHNMRMLKDLFTVNVPEQKDAEGAVTQAAHTYINFDGLLVEGRNVIVMEREARMAAGQRKRTTGRHSRRTMHNSAYNYLMKRNETEAAKQVARG